MKNSIYLFVLCASIAITSCGSSQRAFSENGEKADPYTGTWRLLIEDTPQGNVSAAMTITKNSDSTYSGSVNSDVGTFKLYDLDIKEGKLSAGFNIQDLAFNLIGTIEDSVFKGYVSGMGDDFPANGNKIL